MRASTPETAQMAIGPMSGLRSSASATSSVHATRPSTRSITTPVSDTAGERPARSEWRTQPLVPYPEPRARVLHDGSPEGGFESAIEPVPGAYRPDPGFCILGREDVAGPHDVLGHAALVSAIADKGVPSAPEITGTDAELVRSDRKVAQR